MLPDRDCKGLDTTLFNSEALGPGQTHSNRVDSDQSDSRQRSKRGTVYLVGSGPGHIDYLTVKAQALLQRADVVVYDALVDTDALALVPQDCLKIDVGKRGGKPSASQDDINQQLIQHSLTGKQIVRLKSGDPFIFGRCAAEIEALNAAGCPYEVVPGLSSALAAPLLAGIPLTDPVLSSCFAVFSAHDPDGLNWEALEQIETLVILMGTRHLGTIASRLMGQGRSPQTPIAIIQWASHANQRIWTGALESIVQKTSRQSLSPAVIVVGNVVGLRPYMQPQSVSVNAQPLAGQTILVTRSAGQSSQFSEMLIQRGAMVVEMPALEITPPSSWEALDEAIAHLAQFDWLILTSSNGVDYFFKRLEELGRDSRVLAGLQIAVVGKKTAASLRQYGLQPDFVPPDYVADSLVEHFPEPERLPQLKILFPRVESGGREVLVKQLTQRQARVTEVPAYQSRCPRAIAPNALEALRGGAIDIITFASSKTVQCFHHLIKSAAQTEGVELAELLPSHLCLASIGPQTSATCRRVLGRVDIEAQEYTLDGLTQALEQWVHHRH